MSHYKTIQQAYDVLSDEARKRIDYILDTEVEGPEAMNQFNSAMMDLQLPCSVSTSSQGKPHALTWSYTIRLFDKQFKGSGASQAAAKSLAVADALRWMKITIVREDRRMKDATVLLRVAISLGEGDEWLAALAEAWNKLMHSANGNAVLNGNIVPAIMLCALVAAVSASRVSYFEYITITPYASPVMLDFPTGPGDYLCYIWASNANFGLLMAFPYGTQLDDVVLNSTAQYLQVNSKSSSFFVSTEFFGTAGYITSTPTAPVAFSTPGAGISVMYVPRGGSSANIGLGCKIDGHSAVEAANRNKRQHALNGNQMVAHDIQAGSVARHDIYKLKHKRNLNRWRSALKAKGLTYAAQGLVMQMTDPFHDQGFDVMPMPSANSARSLTICNPATVTIARPANVVGEAKWDAHVVMSNIYCNLPYMQLYDGLMWADVPDGSYCSGAVFQYDRLLDTYRCALGITSGAVVGSAAFPVGLTVFTAPSGENTMWNQVDGANQNVRAFSVPVPTDLMTGEHRLVGAGFEVHNTSPILDKPGSVHVYRVPHEIVQEGAEVSAGAGAYKCKMAAFTQDMPANVAEVRRSQDSKSWEAKEGAYVVARPVGLPQTHRPQQIMPLKRPAVIEEFEEPLADSNVPGLVCYTKSGGEVPTLTFIPCIATVHRWDISGAYFAGLDKDTVLTIDANVFVEHIPNMARNGDGIYARLAKLPPPMPPALKPMLVEYFRKLPVGCPVAMNEEGSWWNVVCDLIVASSPAIDAIVPGAGAVAARVATAARHIPKVVKKVQEIRKSPSAAKKTAAVVKKTTIVKR